jgi:putative endopeptidase
LPLGFSADKMDRAADPRRDFARYASRRWLAAASIPADAVRISPLDPMRLRVEDQVRALLDEAARSSGSAPRGSPRQQVGDHVAAGLDVQRITALGIWPWSWRASPRSTARTRYIVAAYEPGLTAA